jgi:hypothetical protein
VSEATAKIMVTHAAPKQKTMKNIIVSNPFSEQHLLKVIYSMIKHWWKTQLLYAITQVKVLQGNSRERERE